MRRRYYAANVKALPFIAPYDTDNSKAQYCDEDGIALPKYISQFDEKCDIDIVSVFNKYKGSDGAYILGVSPSGDTEKKLNLPNPLNVIGYKIGYTLNGVDNIINIDKENTYTIPKNATKIWIIVLGKNITEAWTINYNITTTSNSGSFYWVFTGKCNIYVNNIFRQTGGTSNWIVDTSIKYIYVSDIDIKFSNGLLKNFYPCKALADGNAFYIRKNIFLLQYNHSYNLNNIGTFSKVIIENDNPSNYQIAKYGIFSDVEIKDNAKEKWEIIDNILYYNSDESNKIAVRLLNTTDNFGGEVKFNKSTSVIGQYCFVKTGIKEITIPAYCRTIDTGAFLNLTTLTTVNFEENSELKTFSSYCFDHCSSLTSVDFDTCNKVEQFNLFSFRDTKIQNVTFHKSLSTLDANAIQYNSFLTTVKLNTNRKLNIAKLGHKFIVELGENYYDENNNIGYKKEGNLLIHRNGDNISLVCIDRGVTSQDYDLTNYNTIHNYCLCGVNAGTVTLDYNLSNTDLLFSYANIKNINCFDGVNTYNDRLPKNITNIAVQCMYNTFSLHSLHLQYLEYCKTINMQGFLNISSNYKVIHIPKAVTSINNSNTLYHTAYITDIYLYWNSEGTIIDASKIIRKTKRLIIHVPEGTIEMYKAKGYTIYDATNNPNGLCEDIIEDSVSPY